MINLSRKNYFQRFDLEASFNLDIEHLEIKYLQLQQQFHPDKLVNKSKEQQIELEHNSLLINEAYKTLQDPLSRAIYLLNITANININDDNCPVKPDQNTLIENLKLRELIFTTSDQEKLKEIKKTCKKEIKIILNKAQNFFEQKDYQNCALELIKAKYLDKAIQE